MAVSIVSVDVLLLIVPVVSSRYSIVSWEVYVSRCNLGRGFIAVVMCFTADVSNTLVRFKLRHQASYYIDHHIEYQVRPKISVPINMAIE